MQEMIPSPQKNREYTERPHVEVYATFWEHAEELRQCLLKVFAIIGIGIAASFIFYRSIFHFLTLPLQTMKPAQTLILISPFDGLSSMFKSCFWIGLIATSPVWAYEILRFIAPAIRPSFHRVIIPFMALSLTFFGVGLLFAFFFTIPLANAYLSSLNSEFGENLWTLSNYLDYTVLLACANGLAFETAVILFFLIQYGIISGTKMAEKRRLVIVAIFIASALLTPPDVLTQIMLAIPLMGIYELGILYARFLERKKSKIRKEV